MADTTTTLGGKAAPSLRDLRTRLARVFPGQVKTVYDLCGRDPELALMQSVLHDSPHKPIVVLGEPRIGKTSLLTVSACTLTTPTVQRLTPIKIEPQGITSRAEFAREVWDGIITGVAHPPAAPVVPFAIDSLVQFTDGLNQLIRDYPFQTFVIYIDEFDAILRRCNSMEVGRILGLVRYLIESCELPITFVFSALPDLDKAITHSLDSPFTNSAETVSLRPLSPTDTFALVLRLLTGYEWLGDLDLSRIYELSGGHPYMIKLLLSRLLEHHVATGGDYSAAWLDELAGETASSPQAATLLGRIYEVHATDAERYVLLWRAQKGTPLTPTDLAAAPIPVRAAAKHLVQRHYLIQREPDGHYDWAIRLFQLWLTQWSEFEEELERLGVPTTAFPVPTQDLYIDAATQQVFLHGREIRGLSHHAYRALYYLALHADRLVDKDELLEYVWAPHPFVTDNGLVTLISRVRTALRDTKRPHRYVITKRSRGYMLQHVMVRKAIEQFPVPPLALAG